MTYIESLYHGLLSQSYDETLTQYNLLNAELNDGRFVGTDKLSEKALSEVNINYRGDLVVATIELLAKTNDLAAHPLILAVGDSGARIDTRQLGLNVLVDWLKRIDFQVTRNDFVKIDQHYQSYESNLHQMAKARKIELSDGRVIEKALGKCFVLKGPGAHEAVLGKQEQLLLRDFIQNIFSVIKEGVLKIDSLKTVPKDVLAKETGEDLLPN